MTTSKKRGRPTRYSTELVKTICKRRSCGESLRAICNDKEMPGRDTVRRWLIDYTDFQAQYVRACEIDADNEFEDLIALADECKDPALTQIYKLRIDTRKWVLSRRSPKKYGDRVEQNVTGPAGDSLAEFLDEVTRRNKGFLAHVTEDSHYIK